jgi:hypothetical protein
MNEAALIATEIQDLASSVGDVASAIKGRPETQVTVNVPEQAAPQINVQVPQQPAPTVEVNVPAPVVNLEPQVNVQLPTQAAPRVDVNVPAPIVNIDSPVYVAAAEARSYDVRVTERDRQGLIVSFVISPRG